MDASGVGGAGGCLNVGEGVHTIFGRPGSIQRTTYHIFFFLLFTESICRFTICD